jgi:secreted PhoX family phosphatase
MSTLTRRQLLIFFAGSAGVAVLGDAILDSISSQTSAQTTLTFTPVRLPHPLLVYQQVNSFLPTGIAQGQVVNASTDVKLATYTVIDDVVVPPEYDRYVIVGWGDKVFPNPDEYVGYNCDYTGFIPIGRSADEGYLWVNHEYVSFPISGLAPETPNDVQALLTTFTPVIGRSLPSSRNLELDGEFLYNLGGSVIRVSRRNTARRFVVVSDAKNRRIHGLSGLSINSERNDGYQSITAWGGRSYQQGDQNYLIGTGPAATQVFNLSVDGLGNRIIGTAYNCSGGTTPWGTILSAEENFQGGGPFFVGVTEAVKPDGTLSSVEFAALGSAQRDGLLPLPRRNGIAGQTTDGGAFNCTRSNEATALPGYQNKTLQNFYTTQGAILCDAFLAANLIGGTPTARPEDIEVHPTTKEVFIAYK